MRASFRIQPLLVLLLAIGLGSCAVKTAHLPPPQGALRAGLRSSPYGPQGGFPPPAYWRDAARSMAARFTGAASAMIWIVGIMEGAEEGAGNFSGRVKLSFPSPGAEYPNIVFADADANEACMDEFDRAGFRVWLQVEPADADMETLIRLVLDRYGRHPCVIGFGVDVEWHRWSRQNNEGTSVSDRQARAWSELVRSYNPAFRLFLKHWLPSKMPPEYRQGLVFISDSQEFASLTEMLDDFVAWGLAFAPAPVGYQFGYPPDGAWWRKLGDPPGEIGRAILARLPNTRDLYWVDFTMQEIWPAATAGSAER